MTLNHETLRNAVAGGAVALRARTSLEPAGGPGDKVFPPTYGADGRETKYAVESRRVEGASVRSVVLDSVASQANRMETALLEAVRAGELALPLVSVDFGSDERTAHLGVLSALEAPHRVFDALLRDSLDGSTLFRLSDTGRRITEASVRDAAALLRWSPTTLLFGGWDSTGPKGGRGAKYERALTSEIVGHGLDLGVKTASRIDPAQIERAAGPLLEAKDGGWTLEPGDAVEGPKKGEPKKYARPGAEGDPGRPSQVNHGNVAPSMDSTAGGVTVDTIEAVTVLSLAALRRLRFPADHTGTPLPSDRQGEAAVAARTALAALGVAAVVLAFDEGFDLRSRCVLYAPQALTFELLVSGAEPTTFTVTRQDALTLVREAAAALAAAGLPWEEQEQLLTPAPRLAELIHRSRQLSEQQAPEAAASTEG